MSTQSQLDRKQQRNPTSRPSDESSDDPRGPQHWIRLGTTARSFDQPPNAYLPLARMPAILARIRDRLAPPASVRRGWGEDEATHRRGTRARGCPNVCASRGGSGKIELDAGGRNAASLLSALPRRGEARGEMISDWICLGLGEEEEGREGTRRDETIRWRSAFVGKAAQRKFCYRLLFTSLSRAGARGLDGVAGTPLRSRCLFLRACSAGYPSRADQRGSLDLAIWINHEF